MELPLNLLKPLKKKHKRLIDTIEICCGHSMTAALLDEAESLQIPVCLLDAEKNVSLWSRSLW